VFNPLPLENSQNPDLIPKFQEVAKAAYKKLIFLSGSTSASTQEEQGKLRSLINSLNIQKTLGLGWNQDLEEKTLHYWKDRAKTGKLPDFLHGFGLV
jgi:UDP-N-acetyl-D-mannosaminuronic acid transferase (WecB/TagA/CpsF family)